MKSHWLQRLANPNERERETFQNLVDTHPDVLPLTGEEYKRAVEASLPHCECGGAFVYDAPIRCPKCRSENHEILKLLSIYD